MATLESLQAKIKKLEQQAESLVTKQASSVIEKIRSLMAEHGLTTADIKAHERSKGRLGKTGTAATSKKSAVAVRYRDPKSGATWSGRGRAPLWIAGAKNRDKFLVEGSAVAAKPASAGKAKVVAKKTLKAVGARSGAGQPKGPQPALYRDPKTGSTWSGRGRAPGWIAGAEDRRKFLIG